MKRIAIFASGAGSNAEKIIAYFRFSTSVDVALVVCNKPEAGVVRIAKQNAIHVLLLEKEAFFRGNYYIEELKAQEIDFIILAGFLWKIPAALVAAFPERILNIHPSLLPKYGGKGMYGNSVHEAVIKSGDAESGVTIHVVDEVYDNGRIIFSASCSVLPEDTPQTLAQRIHALEHTHYPEVIGRYIAEFEK